MAGKRQSADHAAFLVLLVAAAATMAAQAERQAAQEVLVQASFNPITDTLGNRWDISGEGTIQNGTDGSLRNSPILTVNDNQFSPNQSKMTADGSEFVLSTNMNGINVTRRIRVDQKRGAARYLEVFNNPTGQPLQLNISLVSRFSSNWQQACTNTGGPFVGLLGGRDAGVLVTLAQNRTSLLFLVGDPRGKVRATSNQSQGTRGLAFNYSVLVNANETVSLVHFVIQRRNLNPRNPAEAFRPFYGRALIRPEVPKGLAKTVVNFRMTPGAGEESEPGQELKMAMDLVESLAVERSAQDLLVMGGDAQVSGKVKGNDLKVTTPLGGTTVNLNDVAVLWGGAGSGRPMRLYLRNGEILSGEVTVDDLKLTTDAGVTLTLNPALIHALVTHADAQDGKPPVGAAAFVETQDGDRCALTSDTPFVFQAVTAWGRLNVNPDQILRLTMVRDPSPGHLLVLKDGSRVFVILQGEKLRANSLRFGPVEFAPGLVNSFCAIRPGKSEAEDSGDGEDGKIQAPHCEIATENRIVGQIALPELHVGFAVGQSPVKAAEIRTMERCDGDADAPPSFRFELLNGAKLSGPLVEAVIPLRFGDALLTVPASQFVVYRNVEKGDPDPTKAPAPDTPPVRPAEVE